MKLESFNIMGIAVRTTNQQNKAQVAINNLWNQWFVENVAERIPNKVTNAIYNMYTDYESDEHGYYTVILGCAVTTLASIPNGLVGKVIPKSNYKTFVSEGKLPDCVVKTWETIWGLKFNRSYVADFDVYELEKMNPENAYVKTYLSIE